MFLGHIICIHDGWPLQKDVNKPRRHLLMQIKKCNEHDISLEFNFAPEQLAFWTEGFLWEYRDMIEKLK
jgi:hypothetical protein